MWCITFMVQWIGLCKISAVFTTQFNAQLTVDGYLTKWNTVFDKYFGIPLMCVSKVV